MPDEQQPAIHGPAAHEPQAPVYEPPEAEEGDEWLDDTDDTDELPPRPRRRLIGAGGNPVVLALLAALLVAAGFIGGVQVQKGEEGSSTATGGTASSLASRFAGLRGAGTGTGAASARAAAGGVAGGFAGAGAGGKRPTIGTVAYVAGNTLYVTNAEGNTVKVNTSAATSVSKTAKSTLTSIFPGETVTITGSTGAGGAVSAESINVGSGAGGLGALFGGSGKGGAGTGTGTGGGAGGGGAPALFGSG